MKKRVAVLQFPGINSEYETCRAVEAAGMEAELFRWNEAPEKLAHFDAFIIAGGFSYEDRGRAGLIASMDPVMQLLKQQAHAGKPVLGICNGAQILVESGLIPGGQGDPLLMCLAKNRKLQNGKQIGAGFYNENIHLKSSAPQGRTAFTLDFELGELAWAPVAHGEGRFTTQMPELMPFLLRNHQIVFQYCTPEGTVDPNFPTNPNGALENAAAICNPQGNVMAIMPHPERAPQSPMPKIFSSLRKYLEGTPLQTQAEPLTLTHPTPTPTPYHPQPNSQQLYVKLIITDNESQSIENALRQKGFQVTLSKWRHLELPADANPNGFYNANKESPLILRSGESFPQKPGTLTLLVRDFGSTQGTFWEISGDFDRESLLATHIFHNPHAQELLI